MKFNMPEIKSNGKIVELFKNRTLLIVISSILVVALIAGIFGVISLTNRSGSVPADLDLVDSGQGVLEDGADEAVVLPQQVRNDNPEDETSLQFFSPGTDPFAEPMTLTGIAIGGRGGATAIIEAGGNSYVVFEGDYVDDLWAVRLI
ncbi:MAG: hypothetical protein FJ152_07695 [Firmicutes bacterium]|nr:hypothetical protein [Bacillota bacterium]